MRVNSFGITQCTHGLGYSTLILRKKTGITYRVISPFGGTADIPLKEKVKFDDLEEAKAFIGEKIMAKMTEAEREEVIYKILEEDYKSKYGDNGK